MTDVTGATRKPLRKVRMVDVAGAAGVSAMTVSRVMRADPKVSEANRAVVLQAIEALGYVPDSIAGALSSQRSGFVAIVLRKISEFIPTGTIAALDGYLGENGLQLLIGNAGHYLEKEEQLVEAMLRRRPEALVLSGGVHTARTHRLLAGAGIPIVEAFDVPAEPVDNVVGFSNAAATKKMVRHLHEQGYRKIALLGSDERARSAERLRGYLEAIAELDMGRAIVVSTSAATMRAGGEAIVRVVEEHPEADAVVCVSDHLAFGAIMECSRRGWPIPERLGIAGFGNSELSAICNPGITTIGSDAQQIGIDIGRVIVSALERARRHEAHVPATHLLAYQIIERESTRRAR